MPFWDHDPVPPPYLSGGRTRSHSWWPLFWSVLFLGACGTALTVILIVGNS